MAEDILALRREQKSRKPDFIRQRYHTKVRLEKKWRKPRNKQAKLRQGKRGHRAKVKPGYCSPRAVRGFDRSGLKPVIVANVNELLGIKKGEGAIISSKVGNKKRLSLAEQAIKNNIQVINIKDLNKFVEKIKKEFEQRTAKKKEVEEKKKKEKKKEVKKTEKKEEKLEEEKKLEEKKEKDRILATKK